MLRHLGRAEIHQRVSAWRCLLCEAGGVEDTHEESLVEYKAHYNRHHTNVVDITKNTK